MAANGCREDRVATNHTWHFLRERDLGSEPVHKVEIGSLHRSIPTAAWPAGPDVHFAVAPGYGEASEPVPLRRKNGSLTEHRSCNDPHPRLQCGWAGCGSRWEPCRWCLGKYL